MGQPWPLVVAAGGDGTVEKVACGIRGHEAPIAILPTGGSNNLARLFGAGLFEGMLNGSGADVCELPLHVASATWPGGAQDFIESVGVGLVADVGIDGRKLNDRDEKREVGRRRLIDGLRDPRTVRASVTIDGEPMTEPALMVEVMNIGMVGPNLMLAPGFDPAERRLSVVWVPLEAREAMLDWLRDPDASEAPVRQAKADRVVLTLDGEAMHVGDDVYEGIEGDVRVARKEGALRVLVPGVEP
ncbi:hypothetical protein N177_4013 [Lutibaculum baratangense AMV1]|uniref:DAGKc domain-containing protein n=1 Tax=Lutibaculum baratangense AMV1 TaxID=631454 RepID=V4R9P1_9HYPH|nr:hypothetical protein N177_4013 [Lutibaculum baratangense AMV1]